MFCLAAVLLSACSGEAPGLPLLGQPVVNGKDTIYPRIPAFSFTDQDNQQVTQATLKNKIYVADFIFLSCPTICPKMTLEMKKVYDHYAADERIVFVSHTIDPDRDTPKRLKSYAMHLGVSSGRWHFVTGNKDSIYRIAAKSYFMTAAPDQSAPGGFAHSGGLLLIDRDRHIRGVYDGTSAEETDRLIADIRRLTGEKPGIHAGI